MKRKKKDKISTHARDNCSSIFFLTFYRTTKDYNKNQQWAECSTQDLLLPTLIPLNIISNEKHIAFFSPFGTIQFSYYVTLVVTSGFARFPSSPCFPFICVLCRWKKNKNNPKNYKSTKGGNSLFWRKKNVYINCKHVPNQHWCPQDCHSIIY